MVAMRNESHIPVVGRLVWMMFGPALLLLCVVQIWKSPNPGWLTTADFVYGFALVAMLVGRWVEHQGGNARTGIGEPATTRDLYRYFLGTCLITIAIWLVVKVVSNYVL